MSRLKIALVCVPIALGGVGLAIRAGERIASAQLELSQSAQAARSEGQSFVDTLRGEHAERQRLAYDRRRGVALELAAARRDRLLGIVATVAAVLAFAGLSALGRIADEVEEDRRHVSESTGRMRRPG